ncbi:MAG: sensor domain-containing diguanylate cyclase [Candidatus Hydrogenedentota bacterium]
MIFTELFLNVAQESLIKTKDINDLYRILNMVLTKLDKSVKMIVYDYNGMIHYQNRKDIRLDNIKTFKNYFEVDLSYEEETMSLGIVFNDEFHFDEQDINKFNGYLVYFKEIFSLLKKINKLEKDNFEILKLYRFLEYIGMSLDITTLRKAVVSGLYEMLDPGSVSLITIDTDTKNILVLSKIKKEGEIGEFNININDIEEYRRESEDEFTVLARWVNEFWASVREEENKDFNIQVIELGDRKFGYLSVISKEGYIFSKDDERLIKAASRQVAVSLANAMLYIQSITDTLTYLYLRRYFIDRLRIEMHRAERYSHRLTLLMVDLDHFKPANDEYGHRAGDRILSKIGSIIKNGLRDIDIPCRYGGEEFALLLPETDSIGGRAVAERLRRKVEETEFDIGDNKKIKITISIGVATYPDDATNMELFIERADKMLYKAKKQGRNQVCCAFEERSSVYL